MKIRGLGVMVLVAVLALFVDRDIQRYAHGPIDKLLCYLVLSVVLVSVLKP